LFARLHEYGCTLPPLRDRKEDIPLLVRALLSRHGRPELRPTFAFMMGLLTHPWPYNVRELEACVKRAIALTTSLDLLPEHLPDEVRESLAKFGRRQDGDSAPPAATPMASAGHLPEDSEGEALGRAPTETELRGLLAQHRGNVAAVGRALGKERMQIHRWMKRYGIVVTAYRDET
jgi:DNA-binding NtrC family response regulator